MPTRTRTTLAHVRKAVAGFVIAAAGAGITALADDRLTAGELAVALLTGASAAGAVYATPNRRQQP